MILGKDKRNPVFTIYEDRSGERLLVFYGFELLEIVPNDPASPACKLLLARLYNCGIKLSALCQSFQVDPKTVRRWGEALRQGDAGELIRVLEGRNAGHKLTPERWRTLRACVGRIWWRNEATARSGGCRGRSKAFSE